MVGRFPGWPTASTVWFTVRGDHCHAKGSRENLDEARRLFLVEQDAVGGANFLTTHGDEVGATPRCGGGK
jgi:hypothetical protein